MKQILTFLLFSLPLFIFSQSSVITGRVTDKTHLPMIGATIIVDGVGGEFTDEDGYYYFNNLQSGEYHATVSYLGYTPVDFNFTLEPGQSIVKNVEMEDGMFISEIIISSQLSGQAKALNKQFSNTNITNVIASDQIGRFPDSNVGDALKRVSGINVQYDQGEARFGNIRGTAPQLSSVMIDGERVPSAEAEIRSVQLDLVPSDMVQSIEVNKTLSPDMDADAIGGAVNLVTRSAPSNRRVSATLGGGYNLVAQKPSGNASLVLGNRFANDKIGLIVSASYFNNQLGSDNVEAEWDEDEGTVYLDELQMRQYYLQRERQSYSASLDFKLANNHTIYFKSMYNRRKDWENRYRTVYKKFKGSPDDWSSKIERQTKAGTPENKFGRLEDQDVVNLKLSEDHIFGKLVIDWSANYATASEERPNERYFEYATPDRESVNVDISDFSKPFVQPSEIDFSKPTTLWEIGEITEEFQTTYDKNFKGKLNFKIPLSKGKFGSKLKFGGRVKNKTKVRDNDFYEYKPVDEDAALAESLNNLASQSKDNFLVDGKYQLGEFVSREYLGNLDLQNEDLFEKVQVISELAGNFNATENVLAGYVMLEQKLGNNMKVVAGVRLENTDLNYSGFKYQEEDEDNGLEERLDPTEEFVSTYTNLLPNLQLKYKLSEYTVLRAAWTNSIARPNYFDLVPYQEIAEGNELSIGNPELNATSSSNIDLMAEHYFGTIGLISGGVFYKNIKDFIVTQRFEDYEYNGKIWDEFAQPINGGNASLLGVELAFQRQLDFIAPALKGFGVYLNYTWTTSKVTDFNFEGREQDDLSLPGSPQHTLNASLAYEGRKFNTRLSYNFASDFIDEVGESTFFDRYYDSVNYLDLNFGFNISQKFNLYFNVNNILNQPLRYYQGQRNRTAQVEYYNTRFDLGLKYDLF